MIPRSKPKQHRLNEPQRKKLAKRSSRLHLKEAKVVSAFLVTGVIASDAPSAGHKWRK
jgi:hypothetical protein